MYSLGQMGYRVGLVSVCFFAFSSLAQSAAGFVDVKQFGAVGDGVTDDRPAIQNAMNAALQAGVPAVYFGPGTYYLGSSTSAYGQLAISNWDGIYSLDLIGN